MARLIEASREGRFAADVVLVVSNNPQAQGLAKAEMYGVPTVVVPSTAFQRREDYDSRLLEVVKSASPDLICLAGYMRILPTSFIREFPYRIMNIHPALLPAFPGLRAQKQTLDYGAKVSGCTVHFVDEGVDTGPIILQKCLEVRDDDTEETLAARILVLEHQAYPEAVSLFFKGALHVLGRRVLIRNNIE